LLNQGISTHRTAPAVVDAISPVTPPVSTQPFFVLPQTQLGQSVDEGSILTPSDAIGRRTTSSPAPNAST